MPVLMVSLKTWPHVGFSRKRSMEPSSLGDHDAELEGVLDRTRPMVAMASFSSWKATISPRSMSVSTSPEMTRNRSSSSSMALRTEPAVPSGGLLGGVDHLHAELGAVAEVGADVVGQERHRDHDLVDAVRA